jgi:hypothetical protein
VVVPDTYNNVFIEIPSVFKLIASHAPLLFLILCYVLMVML